MANSVDPIKCSIGISPVIKAKNCELVNRERYWQPKYFSV